MARQFTAFPPEALTFLRAIKRNNEREWFHARKDQYEQRIRGPFVAMIDRLAADFRSFAPDLVASPKVSLYRIYRDVRFSENKAPLKTHAAAIFPRRGLPKHRGAGLYVEIAPDGVWAGGGLYTPDTSDLQALREHIAANHRHLRTILESPGFRRAVGSLEGEILTRVPRGFPRDHEAAKYLRHRQFIAGREFPAALASSPRFYSTILSVFKHVAPLTIFLNEPLIRLNESSSPVAQDFSPVRTQL